MARLSFVVVMIFLAMDCSWMGMANAHSLSEDRGTKAKSDPIKAVLSFVDKALGLSPKKHTKKQPAGHHHVQTKAKTKAKTKHRSFEENDKPPDQVEDEFYNNIPDGTEEKEFFGKLAEFEKESEKATKKKMYIFVLLVVVTIMVFAGISYGVHVGTIGPKGFFEFINGQMTATSIIVGMGSGLVFGFIDNAGLFWGMEYLDPILSNLKLGHEPLVLAGYGNTFSDMIGAFLGTFAGKMIEDVATASDDTFTANYPVWTEAMGITVGCLCGIAVPRSISGDPDKKVEDEAIKRAQAVGIPQSEIDEMLEEFQKLDEGNDSKFPGRVTVAHLMANTSDGLNDVIREADIDGNGWVTKGEVMESLVRFKIKDMRARARALIKENGGGSEDAEGDGQAD